MPWEIILWTCITIAFLLIICGIVIAIISAKNVRKRRETLQQVHTELKHGTRVVFAGGVYGRVVKVTEEIVQVEISKGVVVEVSRYSVQSIAKE